MDLTIANSAIVVKIIPTPGLLPHSFQNSDRYNTASMRSAFHVYVPRSRRTTTNSSRSRITCQCSGPMPCSPQSQTSGLCGKFGNRLFTAMVVRARRKNAGIAGPTSNPCLDNKLTQLWRLWLRAVLPNFPNGPLVGAAACTTRESSKLFLKNKSAINFRVRSGG